MGGNLFLSSPVIIIACFGIQSSEKASILTRSTLTGKFYLPVNIIDELLNSKSAAMIKTTVSQTVGIDTVLFLDGLRLTKILAVVLKQGWLSSI
jgi:ABC-type spermidine/putrescine transport system permease subunit II